MKFEDSIKKQKDGALIDIFVTPNAKATIFPAGYNPWRKCIGIKVSSKAEDNKANQEVVKTVANYFFKPTSDVEIVSGFKVKQKTLFIKNIHIDEIIDKLRKSFNGL